MSNFRWARLVPELMCTDLHKSIAFYRDVIGFAVLFERPEDGFAYLHLGEAQLMLEQGFEGWLTGEMELPFGRGINLQLEVDDATALATRIERAGHTLFDRCRRRWYRQENIEHGQDEFLVQDPDGYLLRLITPCGERAFATEDDI